MRFAHEPSARLLLTRNKRYGLLGVMAALFLMAGSCSTDPPRGHFTDARDLARALTDAGVGCDTLRGSAGVASRGLDEAA